MTATKHPSTCYEKVATSGLDNLKAHFHGKLESCTDAIAFTALSAMSFLIWLDSSQTLV